MRAPRTLATTVALAAALGAAPAVAHATTDTTAPVILSAVPSPSAVDTRTGEQHVMLTVTSSDDVSLGDLKASYRLGTNFAQASHIVMGPQPAQRTDVLDLRLLPGMASGPLNIFVQVKDAAGHSATTTATVDVTAGPLDSTGPTGSCAMSTTSVDVRTASAPVTITGVAADPAGVTSARHESPIRGNSVFDTGTFTPLTATTARYAVTRMVPVGQAPGSYPVRAEVSDGLSNTGTIDCGTLIVRHGTTATDRVWGADKASTAAAAALATETAGGRVLYVANADSWMDTVSAASAKDSDLGVLLTGISALPTVTKDALTRLRPQRIVVVGGTGAVSDAVLTALRPYATANTADEVTRVGGPDAYTTSAMVAARGAVTGRRVVLVPSTNVLDAIGPLANRAGASILVADPTTVRATTTAALKRLAPSEVILAGGRWRSRYDIDLLIALGLGNISIRTWTGPDQYAVAAAFAPGNASGQVYLATGAGYIDVAATASHGTGRPIFVTAPSAISSWTRPLLEHYGITRVTAIGGPGALPEATVKQAASLAQESLLP